jgi:hypothetical protein
MIIHKWISYDGSELVPMTDVKINLTLPYSWCTCAVWMKDCFEELHSQFVGLGVEFMRTDNEPHVSYGFPNVWRLLADAAFPVLLNQLSKAWELRSKGFYEIDTQWEWAVECSPWSGLVPVGPLRHVAIGRGFGSPSLELLGEGGEM